MSDDDRPDIEIWLINGKPTRVRLRDHAFADKQFMRQLAEAAIELAAENEQLKTDDLYRRVVERYNRAHGQNRKITLKQICEQMGVSYGAVRQYRSRERKREMKE